MGSEHIPLWQAIPCGYARDWSNPQAAIVLTLGKLLERAGLLVVYYERAETCWASYSRFRLRITTRPLKRAQFGVHIRDLNPPAYYLCQIMTVIDGATMPMAPRWRKIQGQAMRRIVCKVHDNVTGMVTVEPVWE